MASNKGKKPTKTDRLILEFLKGGGIVSTLTAMKAFGAGRLSDNLYRLRQDGNVIDFEEINYTTKTGEKKHHFNFFMKKQEIMVAGAKTETALPEELRNASKSNRNAPSLPDDVHSKGNGLNQGSFVFLDF